MKLQCKNVALLGAIVVSSLGIPNLTKAEDPFRITAATAGGGTRLSFGSSNVLDLLSESISSSGRYSSLSGADYSTNLTYAGVNNAMLFNITGNSANLSIPSINFSRSFSGSSRDDLYNNIESFLKNEGAAIYDRFLEAMAARSVAMVSDGNPNATTAIMATQIFDDTSFNSSPSSQVALNEAGGSFFTFSADGGAIDANGLKGQRWGATIGYNKIFEKNLRFRLSIPLQWTQLENADIYNTGLLLNLGWRLKAPEMIEGKGLKGIEWVVTPTLGAAAGASVDYAAGGAAWIGALSNRVTYHQPSYSITFGSGLSAIEGIGVKVDGFETGNHISQQIFKNGLQYMQHITPKLATEVSVIYSMFLQDAAVKNYWTFNAGIAWNFSETAGDRIRIGLGTDISDDYTSLGLRIGSSFAF